MPISRRAKAHDASLAPIRVNGRTLHVRADGTVATALVSAGVWGFRRSVSGESRAPLCGMGICFECRVTIDGIAHRRACLEPVVAGMEVTLDD